MENIRVRRAGYAYRQNYDLALERYGCCVFLYNVQVTCNFKGIALHQISKTLKVAFVHVTLEVLRIAGAEHRRLGT